MKNNKVGEQGFQKVTSLQAWGKLTEKYFGKRLRVENRKDREKIYGILTNFNLPHEQLIAIESTSHLLKEEFDNAVVKLGTPYWLSLTPKEGVNDIDRLSKLNILSADEGWQFIKSVERISDYKILVIQFASKPVFKGTAIVSKKLNGIVDFIEGDKHFFLTAGLSSSDPMLFSATKVLKYSGLVSKELQNTLHEYINDHPGHYEIQYATLNNKQGYSFFDYNDELAYEDFDSLFDDLVAFFNNSSDIFSFAVRGMPANLGKASGKCRVIMSADEADFNTLEKGEILITDATNPNLTPYMTRVSAIVADLGGVTSHAAIVCRELGIPSIVGAKNATQKLKTGMQIEVDAFSGTVRIIN